MHPSILGSLNVTSRTAKRLSRKLTKGSRGQALAGDLARTRKLNLGCGPQVLNGWTNVDLEPGKGGFVWDLTEALPVSAGSVEYIYTEHFIEHISYDFGLRLMMECRRLLTENGVMRLSTPDLRYLVGQYSIGRTSEWLDMHWSPASPCAMMNEAMRLWGHTYLYDMEDLRALLQRAGFSRITPQIWQESSHSALQKMETRPFHHELILEAQP